MSRDALLILKPDILTGPYAHCDAALAREAVRGFVSVYGPVDEDFEVDTTKRAVAWALSNIDRKVRARDWYVRTMHDPELRLKALRELLAGRLRDADRIATADLVVHVAAALGYTVVGRVRRICTHRDYLGLYAENTHFTRLAGSLRDYLVGSHVEIVSYEGTQELSTLHIFKEMIRRVVRYPTTHYDAVENLLHVSDPGAPDWPYFLNTAFPPVGEAA